MQILANLSELCVEVLSNMGDLALALDISPSHLSRNEHLAECMLSGFCTSDEFVERFTHQRVASWYRALGTDLTIQFDTPEGRLVVSQRNYEDSLDKLHRMAEEIEVDRISADVTVRKEDLKTRIATYVGVPIDALFFFEETLLDRLTLDGIRVLLDHNVLSHEHHTTVGIVSSHGLLSSPYLTVAGLSDVLPADFLTLPSPAYSERKWRHVQMLRDSIALWAAPLKEIAPDMFVVEQQRPGLEKIHRALAGICDVLSVLQFCVSVNTYDSKTWRATPTYPSGRIIDVASNTPCQDPSDSLTGLAPAPYRLYRWAFSAENYDKVDVVRDLLQRDGSDSQTDLLSHLIESAPQLLESARANYKILRHKAFESYLRSRQEAKAAITAFTVSARKSLRNIRADMLQRVLQFFAGLVAYLAASVLQPALPRWVKLTGAIGGIIYLMLIIGFQMIPIWNQYWQERDEAEKAVQSLTELTLLERKRLVRELPRAERRGATEFTVWWWLCCGVYILGGIALLGALWWLLIR